MEVLNPGEDLIPEDDTRRASSSFHRSSRTYRNQCLEKIIILKIVDQSISVLQSYTRISIKMIQLSNVVST
jgi:hypothetical protein